MSKEDDIRDAMTEERSRGRRRPLADATTQRQIKRIRETLMRAAQEGDEALFLDIIRRDLGWKDGSPEFVKAWQIWRNFRGTT